jgi:putative ABC transport system ATP-binding protein
MDAPLELSGPATPVDRLAATLRILLHLVSPASFERVDAMALDREAAEALARHESFLRAASDAAEHVGLHLAPEPMAQERREVFLRQGAVLLYLAEPTEDEGPFLGVTWLDTLGRTRSVNSLGQRVSADEMRGMAFAVTPLYGLERASQGRETPTPMTRLFHLIRLEADDVRVTAVYAAVIGFLALILPVATQSLVNILAFGTVLQPVIVLVILVACGLLFSAVLQAARAWVVERLQRRVFARLSLDLAWRLTSLPPEVRRKKNIGKLVLRFYDIVIVQKALGLLLVDGIGLAMSSVVGLILLFFYHPVFLGYALVLGALFFATIVLPLRSGIRTSVKESHYKHALAEWLHEIAVHPITFSSLGSGFARRRVERFTSEYLLHRSRHWRVLFGQMSVLLVIHVVAGAALLMVGGYLVVNEMLTIGQLVASELVVFTVLQSTAKLDKHLEQVYDMLAALDKLGKLTDLPTEPVDLYYSREPVGLVTSSLHVLARPGRPILANINLEVPPGGDIAVLGEPGSGKSTFAATVACTRKPTSGTIEFRTATGRREQPRALLLGDRMDFIGTLRDNLSCWNPDLHDEPLAEALEAVGLGHLTQKMDEEFADEGGQLYLSSSERALALVARALVTPCDVIVVDQLLDRLPLEQARLVVHLLRDQAHQPLLVATTSSVDVARLFSRTFHLDGGLG